jgi:radical SAM superfamily enzyme YgiQ (UPF0313 family)
MMPKIAFIQPTQYRSDSKHLCKQRRIHLPGLALPLLAAMLPPHWKASLYIEVVDDIDFEMDVDLVAIGTMGHAIYRGIEIASEFRKRGKTVVIGGYMASIAPEFASNHADALVIGDAELSFPLLIKDFEYGRLKEIYNNPVDNLESLPIPRYDLLVEKPIGNMLPVQAGRGCPHSCSFCSIACLYKGKYISRPINDVIRDIKVIRGLGFKRFYLIDDNIVSNPEYLSNLCEQVEPLKMKWATQCSLLLSKDPYLLEKVVRSGGELMSFGIESINQEGLDELNKSWVKVDEHEKNLSILSQAGIVLSSEMIVGTDGDTVESLHNTLKFIDHNRIPLPRIYILTPIPGTTMYEEMKSQGRLLTEDWKSYDGSRCIHKPRKIDAETVTELYWWINNQMYSFKSIIKRIVLNPVLWKKPIMLIFAIVVNLHYRRYVKKRITPNIF